MKIMPHQSTLVSLLGETLLTKSGGKEYDETVPQMNDFSVCFSHHGPTISTARALKHKDFILLYFSAAWVRPCKEFMPVLEKFYKACKGEEIDANIEVVYVSSDRDTREFRENYKHMPWLSLQSQHHKAVLSRKCHCQMIPYLVVLDRHGNFITDMALEQVAKTHGHKNKAKELVEKWKSTVPVRLEAARFSHRAPVCTIL